MIPSKENCREALNQLRHIAQLASYSPRTTPAICEKIRLAIKPVEAFLDAALKRLPSQAALERDARRKRKAPASS